MMNVVHIHNFYQQSPSGENDAVNKTVMELMNFEKTELDVSLISFSHSKGLLRFIDFGKIFWNFFTGKTLFDKKNLDLYSRAEIVHLHNILPFCGRNIISDSQKKGKKIVLTIHNSRSSCLNGSHIFESKSCFRCPASDSFLPGILRKCYRQSFIQSAVFAFMHSKVLKQYRYVDRFIVLNDFSKRSLVKMGIDDGRIKVVTTHVNRIESNESKKCQIFFGGRLDSFKGIDLAIESWISSDMFIQGWKFVIAGSEPLVGEFDWIQLESRGIQFMGLLNEDEIDLILRETAYVVVPSRTYEGMPRMISKAAASGCKVLISDTGALADLAVHSWVHVLPLELDSWVAAFNQISSQSAQFADHEALNWWRKNANESDLAYKILEIYKNLN